MRLLRDFPVKNDREPTPVEYCDIGGKTQQLFHER
jgi:hypothetical protein